MMYKFHIKFRFMNTIHIAKTSGQVTLKFFHGSVSQIRVEEAIWNYLKANNNVTNWSVINPKKANRLKRSVFYSKDWGSVLFG